MMPLDHEVPHDPATCLGCGPNSRPLVMPDTTLREALAATLCDDGDNPKAWTDRTDAERAVSGFRAKADRILRDLRVRAALATPEPDTTLREALKAALDWYNEYGDAVFEGRPTKSFPADRLRAALATPEPSVSVEAAGPSVTWTAANWTPTHRPVMVLLAPIGEDGRCTGCGATPSRETGSCRCPKRLDAALRASVTPPPLDVDRSKACPLDLRCYRFQGHPGGHMYAEAHE